MKDLIVRILFKADDKAVKNQLKKTEQEAKKAANNIGGSLKKAFGSLAASIAGIGLGRVFKSAIDDAAKLEQSLLKLQAAAKNTGQDFGTIEKGLQRLRSEGTLSFQTITEASQQLLQQGFQADQIEPFLRALRNIGALENTVGDTNLAIQSFIRAISTNSIELVDNLSPALRKTVLELGGFNQIAKDANKQQEFLNITLERGAQFADAYQDSIDTVAAKQAQFAVETEKLSEAFGQALAPAFEGTLDLITPIVQGFADFISGLSDTGKSLVAAGASAALAASGFTALAVAIGAGATAMTILTGGLVVVGAALATYTVSQSQATAEVDDAQRAVNKYRVELEELEKLGSSEKERESATKKLAVAQDRLNTILENRVLKERNLVGLNKVQIKQEIEKLAIERQRARVAATAALIPFVSGPTRRELSETEREAIQTGGLRELEAARASISVGKNQLFEKEADEKKFLRYIDALIATQRAINGLAKSSTEYSKALKDVGNSTESVKWGVGVLSKAIARIKDKLNGANPKLEKFIEATNNAAGELDRGATNVDSMSSAVEVLGDESAKASDKVRGLGEGLRGIGGLFSQIGFGKVGASLGVAGAGLGFIGAVGGLFEGIFGQSEDTNSILDQQLELQRQQFDLAKEQAGIEKKYFEDDLEIIRQRARIEGTDPNQALSSAIAEELRRLGFTGDVSLESLELQRERVKQESETILQNKRLLQQAEVVRGLSQGTIGERVVAIQDIARIRQEAGLGRLTGRLSNVVNQTILELTALTQEGGAQRIQQLLEQGIGLIPSGTPSATPTTLQQVQPRGFSFLDVSRGGLQTALGFAPSRAVEMISGAGVPGQIGSLTVATEAMKTTEEKMLDTLDGQLSELKKQTDILSKLTGQDVTIAVLNAISAGQARSL